MKQSEMNKAEMKKRGTGKSGFLLFGEKTLGILIAILCIVAIVFFVTKLYKANEEAQDRNRAKGALDEIVAKMLSLKDVDGSTTYIFSTLKEWVLYSSYPGRSKPLSCDKGDCLCLCPNVEKEELDVECYNRGVCKSPLNVELRQQTGVGADRTLIVGAPVKGADTRYSQITIKKAGESLYEISYTQKI